MADTVMRVETTGEEIDTLIAELKPIIERYPLSTANATFLSILLYSQGPADLSHDELREGVMGASAWMTTYLTDLRSTARPN